MLSIGSEQKVGPKYELVVQLKDSKGVPLGKIKTFTTDSAQDLARLWLLNNGIPSKKRRKKIERASKEEVGDVLKEVENYTSKIRKEKKLED